MRPYVLVLRWYTMGMQGFQTRGPYSCLDLRVDLILAHLSLIGLQQGSDASEHEPTNATCEDCPQLALSYGPQHSTVQIARRFLDGFLPLQAS